ncbi:MAG: AAA family ATPase, partial [Nitrospirae bacterium]|nr:AAA family ATPase [Nitrospirota bacterium]
GKSTVAGDVAEHSEGIVVRSDAVRKTIAGAVGDGPTPAEYGGGIYTPEMTERTYHGLLERAAAVIATGRWAILDATYAQKGQRQAARSWAGKRAVPFIILHCTAPLSVLEMRLAKRAAAGTDISDADVEIMRRQLSVFEPFDREEAEHAIKVDTEKGWDLKEIITACRIQASPR